MNGARVHKVTRSPLFRKYVALFLAVVSLALIPNGLLDIWFSYHDLKTLLVRVQSEQASAAAERISQFVREVEGQLAWATQLPLSSKSDDELRTDAARLLQQAPAVTELVQLDARGRERYRTSRQAMDVIGSMRDLSQSPAFVGAMTDKIYHGPVYFLNDSEPYMTIALAGKRPDHGVIVAQVNLKFIWDVVSKIKVGAHGRAYVVDAEGRLIAHPDISLVLRNIDMSRLPYVQAARSESSSNVDATVVRDLDGSRVLPAHARISRLGWLVFAEMPVEESFAPLYNSLWRSGLTVLAGLMLAFLAGLYLARRMVVPIRTLGEGAARIGGGDLSQRIAIRTGDELEALGERFNGMATQLQESYATLERKVEERTRELELANQAKSRFLATASHDLRQPLHALGLFVAQLRDRMRAEDRKRVVGHIEAALSAMNELFNALLDVSKLDAGALTPKLSDFAVSQLLDRIETTFAGAAREKGLSLHVVGSDAFVRSDFLLLERIVANFVSNAVRYTAKGGIVIGCRRRGAALRIEVWDTGAGIPADQRENIFGEFYRLASSERDQRGGLGLGLAIVDRLGRLLRHPIDVASRFGKGSRFAVSVPVVAAPAASAPTVMPARMSARVGNGRLVAVIDDDPLVLEGMGGLIRSWGCRVVTGSSESAVLDGLVQAGATPDAIISDYHLRDGRTGIEAIARLREALAAPVPAFLMSGDTDMQAQREARAQGYVLLHKPVEPMALRATLTQALRQREPATAN
ncbi:MAG TPA: cache domain-containing protein [Pseudolabrys sp.]|nr:cache domain-containing protein [Pseudolabrys sp.]